MEFLKNIFKGYESPEVLDIATGTGGFCIFLSEFIEADAHYTGLDSEDRLFPFAEKQTQGLNISFEKGDAMALPFDDASFDIVTMANSLHHILEPVKAVSEMWRVLRPGGICLLMEMTRDDQHAAQISHVNFHHFSAEMDREIGRYHRETYTKNELISIFEEGITQKTQTEFVVWDIPPDQEKAKHLDMLRNRLEPMFSKMGDKRTCFEKKRDELVAYIEENGFKPCSSLFLWCAKQA